MVAVCAVAIVAAFCFACLTHVNINNKVYVSDRTDMRQGDGDRGGWLGGGAFGWGMRDPYMPPVRPTYGFAVGGMPTNIGAVPFAQFRQVGVLKAQNGKERAILPLMGRPVFVNRDKWNFYTMTEAGVKLPIRRGKQSCMSDQGCDNIYSGDTVFVEGYDEVYLATVYDTGGGSAYIGVL